jgi:hypothetical protein
MQFEKKNNGVSKIIVTRSRDCFILLCFISQNNPFANTNTKKKTRLRTTNTMEFYVPEPENTCRWASNRSGGLLFGKIT